jgi:hypothetical protein
MIRTTFILTLFTLTATAQYSINGPYNTNPFKDYSGILDYYTKDLILKNKVKTLSYRSCLCDKKGKCDTTVEWEFDFNTIGNPVQMRYYANDYSFIVNLLYDHQDRLFVYKEQEIRRSEGDLKTVFYVYDKNNRIIRQNISNSSYWRYKKEVTYSSDELIYDFCYNDSTQRLNISLTKTYEGTITFFSQNFISCSYDSLFIEKKQDGAIYDRYGRIIESKTIPNHIMFNGYDKDSCRNNGPYTLKFIYNNDNALSRVEKYNCKNHLTMTTNYSYFGNGLLDKIKDSDSRNYDIIVYEFYH